MLKVKQKKYIKIGAAVAVTVLAAYGGYKLYKSGKLDGLISKGKEALGKSNLSDDVKAAMNSIKNDDFKPAAGLFDYKQVSKLTDSEVKAIRAYTTPHYREVNEYLRGIAKEPSIIGKSIGDDITSALNKVVINKDVEVLIDPTMLLSAKDIIKSSTDKLNSFVSLASKIKTLYPSLRRALCA